MQLLRKQQIVFGDLSQHLDRVSLPYPKGSAVNASVNVSEILITGKPIRSHYTSVVEGNEQILAVGLQ